MREEAPSARGVFSESDSDTGGETTGEGGSSGAGEGVSKSWQRKEGGRLLTAVKREALTIGEAFKA